MYNIEMLPVSGHPSIYSCVAGMRCRRATGREGLLLSWTAGKGIRKEKKKKKLKNRERSA